MKIICYTCGTVAMPMMQLRGPRAYRDDEKTKSFCCVGCFWNYMNMVYKSLNCGGRLDMEVDWSGKTGKRIPPSYCRQ